MAFRKKDLREIFSTSGLELMIPGYIAAQKFTIQLPEVKARVKEKNPPFSKEIMTEMRSHMARNNLTVHTQGGYLMYLNGDGKLHGIKVIAILSRDPKKIMTVFSRTTGDKIRLSVKVLISYRNEKGNLQTRYFHGNQAVYVQLGMLQLGFDRKDIEMRKK